MLEFFDSVARSIGASGGPIGGIFVVLWYLLVFVFLIFMYIPFLVIGWIVSYIWPILIPAALVVLIMKWETIAYWYFWAFYPHPARHMVQEALNTRSVLDGPALAAVLGELPPGSSVFRKVRLEQGEVLVEKMQAMSLRLVEEQERRAAQVFERGAQAEYERAAVIETREAIALAALALERAKAAWQTSEAIRRRRSA